MVKNMTNPALQPFFQLAEQIDLRFKDIMWVRVHELNSITISGYGLVKRPTEFMDWRFFNDFINLRVSHNTSTNITNYVLDCSNQEIYYKLCKMFPKYFDYKPYQLYTDFFSELIPEDCFHTRL
jgi:hypothetical protein